KDLAASPGPRIERSPSSDPCAMRQKSAERDAFAVNRLQFGKDLGDLLIERHGPAIDESECHSSPNERFGERGQIEASVEAHRPRWVRGLGFPESLVKNLPALMPHERDRTRDHPGLDGALQDRSDAFHSRLLSVVVCGVDS